MPARSAKRPATRTSSSKSAPRADRPFAPGYGIVGPEDGKGLLPWTWVARQMSPCRTFWVATIHASSNASACDAGVGSVARRRVLFSTGRKSRKGQNLAASPACTVVNDDGAEAVIVEGFAEELKDAAALERVAAAYVKKYKMDPRSMGEPIFVVRPKTVFGLIEKSFPKSATRWKLENL
jgi:hypothetical protein